MPIASVQLNSITPNPLLTGSGTARVTIIAIGGTTQTVTVYATPVGGGTPVAVGSLTVNHAGGVFVADIPINASALDPNLDYTFRAPGPWFSNTYGPIDVIPCFAEGTMIATARGEVPVEALRVGDLVVAPNAAAPLQPIVWIGHSRVDIARHRDREAIAPVLIAAGALAEGVPHRDLRVSPDHAMFLDSHLVPAKHLVNGTTIVQETWRPDVTYWHVELPAHGLLVAEGAVAESYFDDGNRQHFDNGGITTLFKGFAAERANGRYKAEACAPVLEDGPALERIRARIAARDGLVRQSA